MKNEKELSPEEVEDIFAERLARLFLEQIADENKKKEAKNQNKI